MDLRRKLFALQFFGLMLLNLVCLGFFVAKYVHLKRMNVETPLNNIEFFYLGLIVVTFLKDITLTYAMFRGSSNILRPRQQTTSLSLFLIAWIIIPAMYTNFELKNQTVPIMCPSNYNYEKPENATACMLRKSNFILMWAYAVSLCISLVSAVCCFNSDDSDDNYEDNYNETNISNDHNEKLNQFHSRYSTRYNNNRPSTSYTKPTILSSS